MWYEMNPEQYARLMEACKPVPYIVANGTEPISPQARANIVWQELGKEMGFDWTTVRAVAAGGPEAAFTAQALE